DLQPRGEQSSRGEREQVARGEQTPRVELPPTPDEIGEAEGIVEVSGKGFGFLRDPKRGFAQHPNDVFVTPELCRSYGLRDGQWEDHAPSAPRRGGGEKSSRSQAHHPARR